MISLALTGMRALWAIVADLVIRGTPGSTRPVRFSTPTVTLGILRDGPGSVASGAGVAGTRRRERTMGSSSKLAVRRAFAMSASLVLLASALVVLGPVAIEQAQATPACTDTWTNLRVVTGVHRGTGRTGCRDRRMSRASPRQGPTRSRSRAADGSEQTTGLVLGAGATTGVQTLQIDASASLTAGTNVERRGRRASPTRARSPS